MAKKKQTDTKPLNVQPGEATAEDRAEGARQAGAEETLGEIKQSMEKIAGEPEDQAAQRPTSWEEENRLALIEANNRITMLEGQIKERDERIEILENEITAAEEEACSMEDNEGTLHKEIDRLKVILQGAGRISGALPAPIAQIVEVQTAAGLTPQRLIKNSMGGRVLVFGHAPHAIRITVNDAAAGDYLWLLVQAAPALVSIAACVREVDASPVIAKDNPEPAAAPAG